MQATSFPGSLLFLVVAKVSCFQRLSIPDTNPSFYFGRNLALETALRNIASSFFSWGEPGCGIRGKRSSYFCVSCSGGMPTNNMTVRRMGPPPGREEACARQSTL